MKKLYKTKGKTQGHLREIMVKDYKKSKNSILVAEKFELTPKTVLKWANSDTLEDKNSAPKVPSRKYELSSLCLIYWLYEKDNLKGDEILALFVIAGKTQPKFQVFSNKI